MIISLWNKLTKRKQRQFYLLLLLMIIASLSEVISIGLVIPFLTVLTSPDIVFNHYLMQSIVSKLGLTASNQLILPITTIFIIASLFAGLIRLFLLYVLTKFTWSTGADLSVDIYRRTLYQNYSVHMMRNSSEVINGIIVKTNTVINGIIRPILILLSSSILIISVLLGLFLFNAKATIFTVLFCFVTYGLIIGFTKKTLEKNSESIAEQSTLMIKSLQEGLGGIRDVIIDGSQEFYCQIYKNSDLPFRLASGMNQFIAGSPRYIMEALGMIIIALIALVITNQYGGIFSLVPLLGALALAAQRLLPALQQSYASFSQIKSSYASFEDVISLLNQPLPEYTNETKSNLISFHKNLELKNVSFRYSKDSPWILKDINLKVKKGDTIGFIGRTGCGKSTLLDLIMGLLPPEEGNLLVDNVLIDDDNKRAWQKHIAHVPQNIFLSDGYIDENIAFGIPRDLINMEDVEKSAQNAQIFDLIKTWESGFKSSVGEQGIKISGGQRQRIGIARALYKNNDVLVLDEATSSLDEITEKKVMNAISEMQNNMTTFIIAHRISTLKGCDKIFKLEKGRIVSENTYQEILEDN